VSELVCAAQLGAIEAEIVQGRLASEGIQCFLFDLGMSGMNAGTMGLVRVMVGQSDYAAARRILKDEGSI
jgi:hypothetical protein